MIVGPLYLFVDDDVRLGPDFLPGFLEIVEGLDLAMAQPALELGSHYSHQITLRRHDRWARLTNFVEVGPLFSLTRELKGLFTPFPETNPMGWGFEASWASIIRSRGLRMGIVDACPVDHSYRPITTTYSREQAWYDQDRFLEELGLTWHEFATERDYVRIPEAREDYLRANPPPPEAVVHAIGGDSEEDVCLLWSSVMLARPRTTVELGTRMGVAIRTLLHAVGHWGGRVVTVDPDDCRADLDGLACEFVWDTGEGLFGRWEGGVDLLYVDTDPHTYEQTRGWLDTWVDARLSPGGVAIFHDVVPARPEIRVAEAVRAWVAERGGGWLWQEFPGTWGLGLLWRTGDAPDFARLLGAPARWRGGRAGEAH